jgi:hypothetical protein
MSVFLIAFGVAALFVLFYVLRLIHVERKRKAIVNNSWPGPEIWN